MQGIKRFSQYIKESNKDITIAFGDFNPPTLEHQKFLDSVVELSEGGTYRIYVSQIRESENNPLDYVSKIKYMRKMFPRHARAIVLDESIQSVDDAIESLQKDGYKKVSLVTASDDNTLNESCTVIKKDVSLLSSSLKLQEAAIKNDIQSFIKGIPKDFKESKRLFNDIRKNLGLEESHGFRQHLKFSPISDIREAYVAGELFEVGDNVIIKETQELAKVTMLGANYLLLENEKGKKFRKWLNAVEKVIDEETEVERVKARIEREKEEKEAADQRDLERAKMRDDEEKEREKEREERERREREEQESQNESFTFKSYIKKNRRNG